MDYFKLKLFFGVFLACGFTLHAIPLADEYKVLEKLLPTVPTFAELARANGYECEEYNVTTDDGYILGLFRIPGDVKKTALAMHGVLDSANSFIISNSSSLSMTMAKAGYDLWFGNNRGNRYSRNHVTLDPNTDASFWNYSFHEMGTLDLPAIIDFVLNTTGQSQLTAIGHSEGTTIFYVLGSVKPEYNSKIKVMASLAPVAHVQNTRGILPALIALAPELNVILEAVNYQEVLGFNSDIRSLLRVICEIPGAGYDLCYKDVISLLIGLDLYQIQEPLFHTIIEHYPAGSSKKSLLHYSQVGERKSFAQYDYGASNLQVYNSSTPPEYNLTKVTFDVALYVGANDYVSTIDDVAILRSQLPNVVDYQVVTYPLWNHFDFMYGKDLPTYVMPRMLKLFDKY